MDIASYPGLGGDRVTDLYGTARLDVQVCPQEVWLHATMDGWIQHCRTKICHRGNVCVPHVVLPTDLGYHGAGMWKAYSLIMAVASRVQVSQALCHIPHYVAYGSSRDTARRTGL